MNVHTKTLAKNVHNSFTDDNQKVEIMPKAGPNVHLWVSG